MDERELFTRQPARFDTGMSWTSWGAHLLATVTPDGAGARLTVRGRPKSSLLTTRWGEDIAAREVEENLVRGVERHLAGAG